MVRPGSIWKGRTTTATGSSTAIRSSGTTFSGIDISNFVGGQGAVIGNYFALIGVGSNTTGSNYGDIGVNCAGAGNAGSVRIIGNRFDGAIEPSGGSGQGIQTGVYTSCNLTLVMGNAFEGGPAPAIWDDQSLGNPAGRGLSITANQFLLDGTPSLFMLVCSPAVGNATMSCTSNPIAAGVVVGMEIKDTTNSGTFPQLSEGTHNALAGGTYVTAATTTSITVSNTAGANHTNDTIQFCEPAIIAPTSSSFLPVSQQNVFQNMSTCMGSGYGNDGQ